MISFFQQRKCFLLNEKNFELCRSQDLIMFLIYILRRIVKREKNNHANSEWFCFYAKRHIVSSLKINLHFRLF